MGIIELQEILNKLTGGVCSNVYLSYGSMFGLMFSDEDGNYLGKISTNSTYWVMYNDLEEYLSHPNYDSEYMLNTMLIDKKLKSITLDYERLTLMLTFDNNNNNLFFTILPTPQDMEVKDVALFTMSLMDDDPYYFYPDKKIERDFR